MSEDIGPYGHENREWEQSAAELRGLIQQAGLTQMAAAKALDLSERLLREFCSGREKVPSAVLYAMRWIVEHMPNRERYVQVHWKKLGLTVGRNDRFKSEFDGKYLRVFHNNVQVFYQPLQTLLDNGTISLHLSHTNDRFSIGAPVENPADAYATKVNEMCGFLSYRLFTAPETAPAAQLFSVDGRSPLSRHLRSWAEIDQAAEALTRDVRLAAEAAKRAIAKAGAS